MYFVISYDIEDDKIRLKISKILEDYGHRVQESVFECRLTEKLYTELTSKLAKTLNLKGNIRIYPLCKECYGKAVGIGDIKRIPGSKGYVIV